MVNKIVVDVFVDRQDNQNSENKFHSQGTIIGTGSMNILSRNSVKLNDTQSVIAVGPAVSRYMRIKTVSDVSNKALTSSTNDLNNIDTKKSIINTKYVHDKNDIVRKITTLDMIFSSYKGENGSLTNPNANSHTLITNGLYFKYLKDK